MSGTEAGGGRGGWAGGGLTFPTPIARPAPWIGSLWRQTRQGWLPTGSIQQLIVAEVSMTAA